MPGAGINLDLGGFLEGVFGHPKETQTQANAAVTMNAATTAAQSAVANAQIQAQQDIEEKRIDTYMKLGVAAILAGITYVVLKFAW